MNDLTGTIPSPEPRAVLWDLDGTLLDSADYHWLAWQATMVTEGVEWSFERFAATFGQRNDTILRGALGASIPDDEVERIGAAKEAAYRVILRARGAKLLPGIGRWLDHLQAEGWRQAIASSAPPENIATALEVLHIAPYFDAVVSAKDVQRGKPDPQVFLLAATRVDTPPARCIVVEDSPFGIEGARRAGMRSIDVGPSGNGSLADRKVGSLDELAEDAFDRLLDSGA
jgi:HAD superfamily hydrolase (TIGR01509 family)